MRKSLRLIIIALLSLMPSGVWAQADLELSLNIDANAQLPDTAHMPVVKKHADDWKTLLKSMRLNVYDTTMHYPKFVDFCLKVYRWADKTFNSYDPEYVIGSGKHGKVRLVSDNWLDSYYIRFNDDRPMIMVSNPYPNIGIQANYYALSFGYSVDFNSLLSGSETHQRKWNFTFTCARIYAEGYIWQNKGGTKIRRFDSRSVDGGYNFKGLPFDGLDFKTRGVMGLYIFNHQKFSFAAGYSLSNFQIKSQGTWMLGLNGTFYDIDFDFSKLPDKVSKSITLPYTNYKFIYNAVMVIGGYSFNWVLGRHWLINTTILPAMGMAFSTSSSTEGHRRLFSAAVRHMTSVTYNNRRFFVTGNSVFHGNLYFTHSVGMMSGVENFQVSTGLRF